MHALSVRNLFTEFIILIVLLSVQVNPSDVIILEGILIFHDPRVRELLNMKIFVDTGHGLNILSPLLLLVTTILAFTNMKRLLMSPHSVTKLGHFTL